MMKPCDTCRKCCFPKPQNPQLCKDVKQRKSDKRKEEWKRAKEWEGRSYQKWTKRGEKESGMQTDGERVSPEGARRSEERERIDVEPADQLNNQLPPNPSTSFQTQEERCIGSGKKQSGALKTEDDHTKWARSEWLKYPRTQRKLENIRNTQIWFLHVLTSNQKKMEIATTI